MAADLEKGSQHSTHPQSDSPPNSLPPIGLDLSPAEVTLEELIKKLGPAPLPSKLAQEIRGLRAKLLQNADASPRAVANMLGPDTHPLIGCGLLRYLGWTVIARYLSRVVHAFGKWRDEERWLRPYCPPVARCRQWLSWPESILHGYVSSHVVVVALVGVTAERAAHFA